MLFDLHHKITAVTGAASGIGKAIAQQFAAQGAVVCVLDIDKPAIDEAVQEILGAGGQARGFPCDVTKPEEVNSCFNNLIAQLKRIDILVNSAGVAHIGKLENTESRDFDRIFSVNVKGTYHAMQAVIRQMKEQKKGVILNMASVAASMGIPERFAYSMSKGAVVSMTYSVAADYIEDGIRCNCISPARVHTPFVDGFLRANYPGKEEEMMTKLSKLQPVGRMGSPDEIAWLALYLCSDEASFVTGCDYPIDGGFIKLNR